MMKLPESHIHLLIDDTKAFAVLATLMKDGSPQITPVWFNFDGTHILINSAKGRVKDRNMRRNPQIALVIVDPKNPYRYMQIRGKVIEITSRGGRDHINALSKKYTGSDKYSGGTPSEVRVRYKILPEKITVMG